MDKGYDADKLNHQLNISGPCQEVQLSSSLGINEARQNHKSRFYLSAVKELSIYQVEYQNELFLATSREFS